MATAPNLPTAAGQSFDNLFNLWVSGGNTFRSALASFATTLLPTFPESDEVGKPIANWLILIAGLASEMPSVTAPATVDYSVFFVRANDQIYRICWLGAKSTPSSPQISTAQQTALLAAYNANF